jgi:hypothetical protein
LKRGSAVRNHNDPKAEMGEQSRSHIAHVGFVIDDQNGRRRSRRQRFLIAIRAAVALDGRRREEHSDRCSATRSAIDNDRTVVAPDDAQDRRHAQPPPDCFGGEEGVEHAPLGTFVHAASGIGDFQQQVATRRRLVVDTVALQKRFITITDIGAHCDRAFAGRERLSGVENEVEHDLLDVRWICLKDRQIGSEAEFQARLFAD